MSSKSAGVPKDAVSIAHVAQLAGHADALSARMLHVTPAVYLEGERDIPVLIGSGLLIELDGIRLFLTAGHVLDRRKEGPLLIGVSPTLLHLAGEVTRLYPSEGSAEAPDPIDVGFVRLEGKAWEDVELANFAPWEELDTEPLILGRHVFGLLGYPVSKNRKGPQGAQLEAYAYRMLGLECQSGVYAETGHDPVTSLLVGFDRNTMWGPEGMRTSPDLYGVSGGGLWRFGRRLREITSPPKLSAIAIEWHPKGIHRYVLGTRIGVALGALAERYPDVDAFVRARL